MGRNPGHQIKTFDTSRFYGHGSSEEFLGKLDLKGALVDNKFVFLSLSCLLPLSSFLTMAASLQK